MFTMWSKQKPCLNTKTNATSIDDHGEAAGRGGGGVSVTAHSCSTPSPLPFSPFSPLPPLSSPPSGTNASKKSMDDIWSDINLAFLTKEPPPHHHQSSGGGSGGGRFGPGGTIFLDFLGGPDPATKLSLNGPETMLRSGGTSSPQSVSVRVSIGPNPAKFFGGGDSQPRLAPALTSGEKRSSGNGVDYDHTDSGDRSKFMRLIKNRESAARSRSRKQAYTSELETVVARLKKENAKLRRQQEMLRLDAAAQLPLKNKLHRTRTAPF